jgi:hypothetical protein
MKLSGALGYTKRSIEDAWVEIQQLFVAAGRSTEFLFGPQNEALEGAGNRVLFEQIDSEIKFEAQEAGKGQIGTLYDSCVARCWGVDADKDYSIDQGIAAKSLAVDVAAAFYLSFSGKAKGGTVAISNETHVLKYGEQYAVTLMLPCPIYQTETATKLITTGAVVALNTR